MPQEVPVGDRIPPNSLDMEQAVLGSVLLDARCIGQAGEIVQPGDFYHDGHRVIYGAMLALEERSAPIDYLTVQDELRRMDVLENVGGGPYLTQLMDAVASSANVGHYAKMVQADARRRRIINAANAAAIRARDREQEIESVCELVETDLLNAMAVGEQRKGVPFGRLLDETVSDTVRGCQEGRDPVEMSTGLQMLDRWTEGLHRGEMTVIAAETSGGKTALALNIARHVAKHYGAVVMFSLEMPAKDLQKRLLAAEAGLELSAIRGLRLRGEEIEQFKDAAKRLRHLPITLEDTADVSLRTVRSRAREAGSKLALVVVDYLQIMHLAGVDERNRARELDRAANLLKRMALELNVPVVVLSQLNRTVGTRENRRPHIEDLRESGGIGHNADNVWFIHCEAYQQKAKGESIRQAESEIIIAKQRNGVRNVAAPVMWNAYCVRFDDLTVGTAEPRMPYKEPSSPVLPSNTTNYDPKQDPFSDDFEDEPQTAIGEWERSFRP